jgi:hypothetical protein
MSGAAGLFTELKRRQGVGDDPGDVPGLQARFSSSVSSRARRRTGDAS